MSTKPQTKILLGDCLRELKTLAANSVDLIVTSPPYADRRAKTYGGVKPEEYVAWFLPRSKEFLRVLKPDGTFILNIDNHLFLYLTLTGFYTLMIIHSSF